MMNAWRNSSSASLVCRLSRKPSLARSPRSKARRFRSSPKPRRWPVRLRSGAGNALRTVGGRMAGRLVPNTFQIGRKESQGDKGWPFLSYCILKNDIKCSRAERISPAMYRVRYVEQNDKMSEQVRLRMLEEGYALELLHACVQ